MEEDDEDLKLEIYPWVLGDQWRSKHLDFIHQRDKLLKRMDYRAVVSQLTCNEVNYVIHQKIIKFGLVK